MPYVAEARIDIDVAPEVVFDTLLDHGSWKDWMPASFVVVPPAQGLHYVGKRFAIKVAGLPFPSPIRISAVERPRLVAWEGGTRGVLHGNHEFRISSNGAGGTTVVSHEIWSGVLARLLRRAVKPVAEKVGREQLAGLASACAKKKPATSA